MDGYEVKGEFRMVAGAFSEFLRSAVREEHVEDVARKLLYMGVAPETVGKGTALPMEKIEALKAEVEALTAPSPAREWLKRKKAMLGDRFGALSDEEAAALNYRDAGFVPSPTWNDAVGEECARAAAARKIDILSKKYGLEMTAEFTSAIREMEAAAVPIRKQVTRETATALAKEFLALGLSVATVAKGVGLSVSDVVKLTPRVKCKEDVGVQMRAMSGELIISTRVQGIAVGVFNVALNMLAKGILPVTDIAEYTDLPLDTIIELKDELEGRPGA